ncbi:MAG: hypothetical protein MHM6MM_004361 [Cercozoa sp. M6MM]
MIPSLVKINEIDAETLRQSQQMRELGTQTMLSRVLGAAVFEYSTKELVQSAREQSLTSSNPPSIASNEIVTSSSSSEMQLRKLSQICSLNVDGWSLQQSHQQTTVPLLEALPLLQMKGLRSLSCCDNGIIDVSPLAQLTQLEELSLERNEISDISSLANLTQLQRVELSHNRLTYLPLDVLEAWADTLTMLSVEHNRIDDKALKVFGSPTSERKDIMTFIEPHREEVPQCVSMRVLQELYISGNNIREQISFLRLSGSQQLIILDTAQNDEMHNRSQWREFCAYHLPHVHVLDGVPVSPEERVSAQKRYHGRLSREYLQCYLPSATPLHEIQKLSLCQQELKILDTNALLPSHFTSLTELDLSSNKLRCIDVPLLQLRSLRTLCLRGNEITAVADDHSLSELGKLTARCCSHFEVI